ncbi:MAG: hypothetical protein ACQETQ_13695, partial [Spirochaetota bacterium]
MGPYLDRSRLQLHPLSERINRVRIVEAAVTAGDSPIEDNPQLDEAVAEVGKDIRRAQQAQAPVVIAFGAHTIKNGMGPLLAGLIEAGWVSHLATNGAGIIHDWEFAFQGESSEHVQENVHTGRFGLWHETGFYLNVALAIGAFEGRGYGESIGAFVENEGFTVPTPTELAAEIRSDNDPERAAAAADLRALMSRVDLDPGPTAVAHPFRRYGLQAAAYRLGVPFTSHPMFGHDIIYCHPANFGAAIGRAAERDFLSFAETISRIDGGVYLSIGSAVMSPMIFEKSFAMAQNVALQEGRRVERHSIHVVDLAEVNWDWR